MEKTIKAFIPFYSTEQFFYLKTIRDVTWSVKHKELIRIFNYCYNRANSAIGFLFFPTHKIKNAPEQISQTQRKK
ncbi:hypothetical protein EG856_00600 [Mycoplasmopsis phocirhinis]|uniref:Uncharacterized protein n=1 Tax=Mycoplasmopsis phocirhinis TaxID=142650 RepID=A0A4V0ZAE6_9BACT|nr:hypothetical protein [Mycoplasmopsis phocirhinis]QBF34432.1 hypothetical protein EG856_00600 [Mycoplasmopsis phocirhinis]